MRKKWPAFEWHLQFVWRCGDVRQLASRPLGRIEARGGQKLVLLTVLSEQRVKPAVAEWRQAQMQFEAFYGAGGAKLRSILPKCCGITVVKGRVSR
jgi:hypothetical protein